METFRLEKVGKYFNEHFISLRLQMDSTAKDDSNIRRLYKDAQLVRNRYSIKGYPTVLFFSPDGEILSKTEGALDASNLLNVASEVLKPERNYYLVLNKYKKGKRDLSEMAWLAKTAIRLLNDTLESEKIKGDYLKFIKGRTLITKVNIEFMREFFSHKSSDAGFEFFFHNADSINSIMEDDNYAQSLVHGIIYKEMIYPVVSLVKSGDFVSPNWDSLSLEIRNKYNEYYAERITLSAKLNWNRKIKRWPEFTKHLVKYMDNYGPKKNPILFLVLNNNAWSIFQYSNNPDELKKALEWSAHALLLNPSSTYFDTYANILYKLNRIDEALIWQEIAVKQQPNDASFQESLDKMKKGIPTWPVLDTTIDNH
jgi:hypothetical protein